MFILGCYPKPNGVGYRGNVSRTWHGDLCVERGVVLLNGGAIFDELVAQKVKGSYELKSNLVLPGHPPEFSGFC